MQLSTILLFMCCNVIVTYVITKIAFVYTIKFDLLDHPSGRTSHFVTTPRGGGVSIVVVFLFSMLLLWSLPNTEYNNFELSIITGGIVVSAIGLLDDHKSVPAKWRFLVHFVAAFVSLYFLTILPNVPFFNFYLDLSTFGYIFYSLVLVWLLNLYNFMDGIDGIAGIEAISVLLGVVIIFYIQGDSSSPLIPLLLSASIVGFLFWNWPPAKIFMGDACSGFLGFSIGLMAISTSSEETINLWSWLILLGVFVIDATYTLICRAIKGDKWYEAHRSHAYQILSRRYKSHKKITLGVLFINIFWLLPFAYLAAIQEYWAPVYSFIALIPILFLVYKVGAGVNND